MKKLLTVFCAVLITFGLCNTVYSATITIMNDYDATLNLDDIIHLGDLTDPVNFWQPSASAKVITFNFDVPIAGVGGEQFTVSMKQFQANYDLGYLDPVLVNGTLIGYLTENVVHWYTDVFTGDNGILNVGNNTLTIESSLINWNWDDFEFTDLHLNYNPVPIPGAIWLLSTGVICLLGLRKYKLFR